MLRATVILKLPQLSKEILWSTFVQFGGKALQIGLGIFTVKLITNALGSENYGVYGKISEFSLFFATAANLGIFGNMVRKMSLNPSDGKLFGNALLLRLFTGLLFFGAGWGYAWFTIQDQAFLVGTLFFMSSLLLDFLTTVCDALLQAHYKMGRATLALLLGRVTNLGMVYALSQRLLLNPESTPVELFVLAPLLASVVTLCASFLIAQRTVKPIWSLNIQLLKELFWTSLPFGIINILNNLYFRFIPSAVLAKKLSEEQFGVYSLSLHLASTVSLLSTLFMFSVLPELEKHLKNKDWDKARTLYKNAKLFLSIGFVAVVGLGTWLAPWAISLVSSKDFISPETWFLLPMLLVLAGVSYFYDLAFLSLFALKQEIWWLKRELLALGLCLIFVLATTFTAESGGAAMLILTGAIAAEAAMAHWGMKRLKQILRSCSHKISLDRSTQFHSD